MDTDPYVLPLVLLGGWPRDRLPQHFGGMS